MSVKRKKNTKTPSNLTKKQHQIISFLNDNLSPNQIANKLNISRNAVLDRLKALKNKGYVKKITHKYHVIKETNQYKKQEKGKSVHDNEFIAPLLKVPIRWTHGDIFFQSLNAKEFFHNKSTKQTFFYFDNCTVRINNGKNKTVSFFIKDQVSKSFNECQSRVWDVFTKYYQIISSNGIKMERTITSKNPDFANPDGFFAKLATRLENKKFKIDTEDGEFYVDFSLQVAEEETKSLNVALRMEQLADSALNSKSDFQDLDKVGSYIGELAKCIENITVNAEYTNKNMAFITEAVKANTISQTNTNKQISTLIKLIHPPQNIEPEIMPKASYIG